MKEWTPYLEEMIGAERGSSESQQVLLVLEALATASLPPAGRAELLEQISEWDSRLLLFAMPIVASLASDAAPTIRSRVIEMVLHQSNLFSDELLKDFTATAAQDAPSRKNVEALLERVAEILLALELPPRDLPLSSILLYREPLIALSAWLAIERLAHRATGDSEVRSAFEAYFTDGRAGAVGRRLHGWLMSGPLLLRYYTAEWVARSGFSLLPVQSAADLLFSRYCRDQDAMVCSAALAGCARLTLAESLLPLIGRLRDELAELERRREMWIGPAHPQFSPVRLAFSALLRAAGTAALKGGPHAPDAMKLLAELVRPSKRGGVHRLVFRQDRSEAVNNARVLQAALLLNGRGVQVHVCVQGTPKNLQGEAGLPNGLSLADTRRVLPPKRMGKGAEYAWVAPVLSGALPDDPLHWTFEIVESAPPQPLLNSSLLPLVSAGLPPLAPGSPRAGEWLLDATRGIESRGQWMAIFCDLVGRLVAEKSGGDVYAWPDSLSRFVTHLSNLAVVAHLKPEGWRTPEGTFSWRKELGRVVRGVLLKQFTADGPFDCIRHALEQDESAAELQVALARSAMRSLSGEPERRWINTAALVRIAQDQKSLKLRGNAAMILRFAHARPSDEVAEVLRRVELSDDHLLNTARHALAFVPEAAFAALANHWLSQPARFLAEPANAARVTALRLEMAARALEHPETPAPMIAQAVSGALAALERAQSSSRKMAEVIPKPVCRRVLHAYAHTPHRLEANAVALLTELLRRSSASDWSYYQDCCEQRSSERAGDDPTPRIRMEILAEREHETITRRRAPQDRHAFVESFSKHQMLQKELLKAAQGADALQDYLEVARSFERSSLHGAVALLEGELVCQETAEDAVLESCAVLRRSDNPGGEGWRMSPPRWRQHLS